MWWVLIILVIIIAAFAIPKFGKVLLILVGLLAAVVLIWYVNNQREEEQSKNRISINEIEFLDLRLVPSYSAESFKLVGRIRNKSPRYTLSEIRLKLSMKDCVKPGNCEIVGETTAWMWQSVPPGQARDFDESIYFSNLGAAHGKREWNYPLIEIKGK